MAVPKMSLEEALAAWDGVSGWGEGEDAEAQRTSVLRLFPLDEWPRLPIERYALGTGDRETFCYLMEFGTRELGSIGGGSSRKHLIYRKSGTGEWWFDKRYSTVEQAWESVRGSFVEVFDAAAEGNMEAIETIDPIGRLTIGAKATYTYFPDRLVPIYSAPAIAHFWGLLGGDGEAGTSASGAARLLALARTEPRLADASPLDIGRFLYWWADPREARRVVKIAPGPDAMYWNECRDGGYICVGWDEVPTLAEFEGKDEFKARFRDEYGELYKTEAKLSAKANEVWTLRELEPGDLVIANRGTSRVLSLGTVVDPGYEWRPDRAQFKHTVRVEWDESYAQDIDPIRSWATVTVAKVPYTVLHRIERGRGSSGTKIGPGDVGAQPTFEVPVDPVLSELASALDRKGQAILYGPPGTGKTYMANRFAIWWLRKLDQIASPADVLADAELLRKEDAEYTRPRSDLGVGRLTRVTFHPSYTYEDFVEGYRPVDTGSGQLVLKLTDGVFKRLCTAARSDPSRTYLLLVDEINRGNIPKIFGELITLLETDKRGMQVVLPQSRQLFDVPPNLRVIGTMNTADRSIKLLDAALRRRFAFIELMPEPAVLRGGDVGGLDLEEFLEELNRRIAKIEGREKQIGHSYLLGAGGQPISDPEDLAARFRHEILPLLQEYAYEDYKELAGYVGPGIVDAEELRLKADVLHDPAALVEALRDSFMPKGSTGEDPSER